MGFIYDPTTVLNESDVEQKLISPLLLAAQPEGFGYSQADFKTKASLAKLTIDKGASKKLYFPDYAVILQGLPLLVIEAKGPGEDLTEAMREARLYAAAINSRYESGWNPCEIVMATNGAEIRAGHWDSEDYISTATDSLSTVDSSFSSLMKLASKTAVQARCDALLKKIRRGTQYYSPLQMMGGKNVAEETVGENSFGSNVSVEYQYLFDPRTNEDRERLVTNAYVPSVQRSSHVPQIDKLIRAAVPPHMTDATPIANTGVPGGLFSALTERQRPGELCLLIGSAGSGKSTFTDYVRASALDQTLSIRGDWLHVNLNPAPLSRDRIYSWLLREIMSGVASAHPEIDMETLDFQRKIYSRQLSAVAKKRGSLYKEGSVEHANVINETLKQLEDDQELTAKQTLEHLYRDRGRLLIVILDNCDKRTRDDQLLMFEVASWLKENMYCMVFLPLRDTTYDNYRDTAPLDTVVKDLVFRIDPPRLEQVIQARLEYASRELQTQHSKFSYLMQNGIRVECSRDEVGQYLSSLVSSVFQNQRFKTILSGLAGRNIRKGIEILLEICKSGHIPEDEILKARTKSVNHHFPSHLIMQILLKGKRRYYSDSNTHLKNLFHSVDGEELPDPFTRLAILKWLHERRFELGPNRNKGFHKVESMLAELQGLGFSSVSLWVGLRDLVEADCVIAETSSLLLAEEDLVSLSAAGSIHLGLLEDAQYLATISEAVKFRSTQPPSAIKTIINGQGLFHAGSREGTLQISKVLVDYLSTYYTDYHIRPEALNADDVRDYVNMEQIKEVVERQIANAPKLALAMEMESRLPLGTVVQAKIVAVRGTITILGLPDECYGYIRSRSISIHATPKKGASLNVKVGRWNPEYKRFEVSKS